MLALSGFFQKTHVTARRCIFSLVGERTHHDTGRVALGLLDQAPQLALPRNGDFLPVGDLLTGVVLVFSGSHQKRDGHVTGAAAA